MDSHRVEKRGITIIAPGLNERYRRWKCRDVIVLTQSRDQYTYRSNGQSIVVAIIGVVTGAVLIGMMLEARHTEVLIGEAMFLMAFLVICIRSARGHHDV